MTRRYGMQHIRKIASTDSNWESILSDIKGGLFRIEWINKTAWMIRIKRDEGYRTIATSGLCQLRQSPNDAGVPRSGRT